MSARSGGSFRRGAVAAASLAACAPLWAADGDDEVKALTTPQITLGAGIGGVSKDNTRFGQYTGLTKEGLYNLIDLDLRTRNDETGTWLNLTGRNLGLESSELRFEQERQGKWGYFLEYNQLPRYSPYTPVTTLAGADGAQQVVNGSVLPQELEFKTLRKNFNGGVDGRFGGNYDLSFRFSDEEKQGKRLFGRSGSGATGSFQEFISDPIDYRTQIYEVSGGYTGEKLQLKASFLGTNFSNSNMRLDVTGSASTFSPIGLPPDNQSQQLSLTGGYTFSPTLRANFRAAYSNQTQTAAFIDTSSTGRSDLGGKVTTSFLQGGLSWRASKDLTVTANLRSEDRDDKTPVVDYFNITTTNTATGVNEPRSIRTRSGKVEGVYRLSGGYSAVAGLDLEQKTRNTSDVRVVSFRETTDETALRAELRRAMSDTVNGSLAYIHSSRTGSPWQTTVTTAGTPGSNLVHPMQLADRDRDMLRAKLGWAATQQLDLQFVADYSKDDYGGRTFGLQDGKANRFAVDGSYRLNDAWQLTAWLARDEASSTQTACEAASATGVCPDTAADPVWRAKLSQSTSALGAGVRGRPMTRLEIGADLQYAEDTAKYEQGPLPAGIDPLPDAVYKHTTLKLYAKQDLDKRLSLRVQYIYDRFTTDDWTWTTWTYGDGTTVLANPNQKVQFIALQLQYRM